MVKVRFAPSPTGYLHIGNMRIAFFNWLYALQNKGQFILRYDDTDQQRSKQDYIDAILEDLKWLGIVPNEIAYQSKRFDRYDEVAEQLKKRGLLYPCYETADELARRRKILLSRKKAPIYGREALKLSEEQKQAYIAEGRRPHWRFLLPNFSSSPFETQRTEITWHDKVRGTQNIDLASMSDPVLIREDGSYLYTLPSVIDDIDMGITDIIRGDDHVTNTGAQLAIFDALGAPRPNFGHINLLTTADGEGLSKRKGDLSVRSLREEGFEPMAICCLAVLIGTSENIFAYQNMQALCDVFQLDKTSKSAAKFDSADLSHLNKNLIHEMPFEAVADRLAALNIQGPKAQEFWCTIQPNLEKFNDITLWWDVIHNEEKIFPISEEDKSFIVEAYQYLPPSPWDKNSWKQWIDALKLHTGRKGSSLFKPLRMALTGKENGPELALLLPLMAPTLVKKRLYQ